MIGVQRPISTCSGSNLFKGKRKALEQIVRPEFCAMAWPCDPDASPSFEIVQGRLLNVIDPEYLQ
jgi:hypothetical protein